MQRGNRVGPFALEHSKAAYRADYVVYALAVTALAVFLLIEGPHPRRLEIFALTLAGLGTWTLVEYALHRFLLHGVPPFREWHAQHHQRPTALIGSPTIISATLFATLVFLPALLLGDLWRACALTLGMSGGYFAYAVTHHATHHWRADSAWLQRRKRWHALHHHVGHAACYGVTSGFWDHIFGSTHRAAARVDG
jgi:sterol desaturase/sphingolipid hydroxylase (fatty acid hydroxylase superfamily)